MGVPKCLECYNGFTEMLQGMHIDDTGTLLNKD